MVCCRKNYQLSPAQVKAISLVDLDGYQLQFIIRVVVFLPFWRTLINARIETKAYTANLDFTPGLPKSAKKSRSN